MKKQIWQKTSVSAFIQALLVFCPLSFAEASDAEKYAKPMAQATAEFEKGNYQVAQDAFLKLVTKYPGSAELRTMLAKSYKRLGKFDEAKGEFRAAIQCDPNFADAYYELGCMMESDKDYRSAVVSFEKYLELKPDSSNRRLVADRIQFCKGNIQ
ncbi:MAG: tetratricopeptide repeat protein [Candidatus Melainabacteria bacterium]|nr:tetratricopeptide repeat protein [Candidatus Melainabacteria bacterium]